MKRTEFTPEKGKIYQNEGGGSFACIGEPDQAGRVLMRNTASGWTFFAHGVGIYEDGSIDWDYSTEGRFDTETTPIKNVLDVAAAAEQEKKRIKLSDAPFPWEIAEAAVNKWGKNPQIDMAIEEMSELIKALLKERRVRYKDPDGESEAERKAVENISEEMADVYIMLSQLQYIFDNKNEVRDFTDGKLERLKERIEESEGGANE